MRYLLVVAVLLAFEPYGIFGQTLTPRSLEPAPASTVASVSQPTPRPIPLAVPTGMALKIVLNQTVRIRRVGQPIYGRIAEPVYAFDQMVIPAGATVVGEISAIDSL